MKIFKLIFKNAMRHPLRTLLTFLGIAIVTFAFGFIRTAISAWYAGVEASAQNRMVTLNATSLMFPLPLSYRDKIAQFPGVQSVGTANWFGAYYKDPKDFFANFAVDDKYLEMYSEFVTPPEQLAAYKQERNACIIGRKLATRFNWKLGDAVQLTGTIFYGQWDFVVRGIYDGANATTDETAFLFHWEYINERLRQESPELADNPGWFVIQIADGVDPIAVGEMIDNNFKNSPAETKTDTERAFNLSFISMAGTIMTAMEVISVVVVLIILLVLANTMAMTARERMSEYAVLKTLGFRPFHIIGLIGGESLLIALGGFVVGLGALVFIFKNFSVVITKLSNGFFGIFNLTNNTIALTFASALLVGVVAAAFPTWRAVRMRIADGLHRVA
jgi:putative ABC transport system permease protein